MAKRNRGQRRRPPSLTKAEELEMWKTRIRWAEEQLAPHVAEWQRNVRMLQGRIGSFGENLGKLLEDRAGEVDSDSYIYVNVFYSIQRSMFPSMYVTDPIWIGKPQRPGDERTAPLWGEIINQRHREMDIERIVERAVADAIYCSRAIIKQAWLLRFEEPADAVLDGMKPQAAHMLTSDVKFAERFEAYAERPLCVRVAPENFLFDFTCGDVNDSPWYIERVWKRPEDLINDPNYDYTDHLVADGHIRPGMVGAMEPGATDKDDLLPRTLSSEINDDKRIALYEIHDIRNGELLALTMGCDRFHRRDPYPYSHRVLRDGTGPYSVLSLTVTVPDEPNPIPLASAIRDLVLEKSDIRTMRLEYQRRSLPMLGVQSDQIEDEDVERLADGELAKIVRTKIEPRGVVQAISWPAISQDVSQNEALVDRDIQEISGSTPQSRGFTSGATATESSIVDTRMQGVEADARRRVRNFMIEVGTKTLALEHEFMPDDGVRWTLVTGRVGLRKYVQPGQPPFASYKKQDIPEFFEIDIDVKSFTPTPPELKRKQMMDLTNMLAQFSDLNPMFGQMGTPAPVDGTELIRLLIESFDIPNAEAVLPALINRRPAQDPAQEFTAWLSGIAMQVSDSDNHAEHAVRHNHDLQQAIAQGWQPRPEQLAEFQKHQMDHQLKIQAAQLRMAMSTMGGMAGGGGGGAAAGQPGGAGGGKVDPSSYNRGTPDIASMVRGVGAQRGSGV